MHFLVDMNMPRGWIEVLSRSGHDATYWRDIGVATARDDEIMAYARSKGLVVMTRDLDFGELLALNSATGPSVVQLRDGDTEPEQSADHVLQAIDRFAADIERGALVTIAVRSSRVRSLPIKKTLL